MAEYGLTLTFNASGGSGAPSSVIQTNTSNNASVTVSATIPSTTPTRSGYSFLGWSGNGGSYSPGQSVSHTFTRQFDDQGNATNQYKSIAFSASWGASGSTWGTTPSSVQLNGSTEYTFNITKASTVHHHTVVYSLGTAKITHTNVGTSDTVTFPTTWQEQIPSATSGTIVCTIKSYNSSGTQIGSNATKNVTGKVPSGVVPTLSIVSERVNTNATIATWDVLVQGYSKIKFTATASGTNGSTISSIAYSGANLSKSGSAMTATSGVIQSNGSQTWTVTATDSRGRTATQTYTETVYDYSPPAISRMTARRCDSGGTVNEATGTYALLNAVYAYSSVNSNNAVTQTVEYKLHSLSTWTMLLNAYTSGTDTVIGGGAFDADKTYDIRLTVIDSLGNSATYSVLLASVQGFALGLKNDRARFGGVPVRAGLQIDWDLYLGNRKVLGSLWTGSWSSDDITVSGISDYTMFIVHFSGLGTSALVFITESNGTKYFRGEGGYSSSSTNETRIYVNATLSGDTLTMVDCHQVTTSGTQTPRTVSEIIGII